MFAWVLTFRPVFNTGVREQVNERTSFLDGSMIYGSDAYREQELRANCELRLDNAGFNNWEGLCCMLYEQTTLYSKFIFKVVILVSFSLKKIISSF